MIHDLLGKLANYANVPRVTRIVAYLASTDVTSLQEGDIPIDGEDLYVKVLRYHPEPATANYFETHREYTDVQIMFDGDELMQTAPRGELTDHTSYDAASDYQFFTATDAVSSFIVREGEFVVFFPGEALKPGCRWRERDRPVLKLVFKIRPRPPARTRPR